MSSTTNTQSTGATRKSPSRSETGHLKNVANFEDLIAFCTSFGAQYNPSNPMLSIESLKTKQQESKDALSSFTTNRTKLNASIDMRRIEFNDLKSTATRAYNNFSVSGVDNLIVLNAKTHLNKLQGYRKRKTETAVSEDTANETKEVKQISTSQQSYDRQIDHFASMIEVFTQSGTHNPNEADLTLSALNTKTSKLKEVNTTVINDFTSFSNGLIHRNDVLYNSLTGVVNTALMVKKYVKSIFGASSPQFKQVNSIEFRNR